jgi:hypothetical protein
LAGRVMQLAAAACDRQARPNVRHLEHVTAAIPCFVSPRLSLLKKSCLALQ